MNHHIKLYHADGTFTEIFTVKPVIKATLVIPKNKLKPNFDWRGLWYTSQGLFVEILGTEGFILDEKGNRLQTVCVDEKGFLSPIGGRLEIAKRNYIRSEDSKVVQRGKIDKEWPSCQTQF
jgi:hypothetical protein